jgi:membrane fusion protein, copper/silver efflux system
MLFGQINSRMKTNRWLKLTMLSTVLGLSVVAFIGCANEQPAAKRQNAAQYTCPMHPELVKDTPGDCPKCGMKLVQKK